mgnify:CR=1 FL=1
MNQKRKLIHKSINEEELLRDHYYTDENKTFDQVVKEIIGDQKRQIEEAISRIKEEGVEDAVKRLCAAAIRDKPDIEPRGIRLKVIDALCPHIWRENYVRTWWPSWMKNKKSSESISAAWDANPNMGNTRKNNEIIDFTQDDLDREEEQKPVKSYTMTEYEEAHPEIAESPFEAIGEINRAIARLWKALTKRNHMPTREDDVKKQYIIPARDRLKDIINGSSKVERDFLFNWLTWLIMEAKDCRDLIEKADTTAYDTRE